MTDAKHTPGPWEVRGLHVFGTCRGGSRNEVTDFRIADVRGYGHLSYREDGEQMQDANARLIAAAPEMLATLEGIRRDVNTLLGDESRDGDGDAVLCGIAERVDDAIAKAKGGD